MTKLKKIWFWIVVIHSYPFPLKSKFKILKLSIPMTPKSQAEIKPQFWHIQFQRGYSSNINEVSKTFLNFFFFL